MNIQKAKIMARSPITSWQLNGDTMETVTDVIFLRSTVTADGDCSHEVKGLLLLGRKVMTNLDSILKKQGHLFANKGPADQSYGFFSSVYFSSVAQSCLTLCDPMDCSTPSFPVHHQLLELAQTHVHRVGDTIQPSHSLSSPSATFNLSQHQHLFYCIRSSHQLAKVLEFQLQHQSFQ